MKIGFTGSREGMTDRQHQYVALILSAYVATIGQPLEFHHGDCVGADEESHVLAKLYGYRIVVHPPINESLRAWCDGDEIREPAPYLVRDKRIVDETEVLVGTPRRPSGGGTWKTIGFARDASKSHVVIDPDGTPNWSEWSWYGEPFNLEAR